MLSGTRFVHVNIVAEDWRALTRFYEEVFGCERVGPERDLSGQWLEDGTGVPGVQIRGTHLRLPGCGRAGPTLEIFEYNRQEERVGAAINRPGLAHIAFGVEDVAGARDAVLAAGGGEIGEVVSLDVPGVGRVEFVYLTDPEGNILELQRWSEE